MVLIPPPLLNNVKKKLRIWYMRAPLNLLPIFTRIYLWYITYISPILSARFAKFSNCKGGWSLAKAKLAQFAIWTNMSSNLNKYIFKVIKCISCYQSWGKAGQADLISEGIRSKPPLPQTTLCYSWEKMLFKNCKHIFDFKSTAILTKKSLSQRTLC